MKQDKFGFVDAFKKSVLDDAWTSFLEDRRSDVQNEIGMWRWAGDCVPFLHGVGGTAGISKGVLSFNVVMNEQPILFSIWLQTGEVRVGYRIPLDLMGGTRQVAEQRLSILYDGQPCQRIVRDKDATLFDSIFKNGFADWDFMSQACVEHAEGDGAKAMLISDRIHDILVHVFIAVINELISINNYVVRNGFVGDARTYICEVRGDIAAFKVWAKQNRVSILTHTEMGLGSHVIRCEAPAHLDIPHSGDAWKMIRAQAAQSDL